MRPRNYFDTVAEQYSKTITSGFVGALKRREKSCLMRLLSPRKGERILDVGCGSGFYANLIKETGAQVFCVDISPAMVRLVRASGIEAEVHDIESLNLNREFDKILVAGALEFCEKPSEALRNLRRHTGNNGRLALTVPNLSIMAAAYWLYHLTHGFRIRLFSLGRIIALLDQAGFKVEAVEEPTPFLFAISATARI